MSAFVSSSPGGFVSEPAPSSRISGRIAALVCIAFAILYGAAAGQIEYAFSSDPIGPRGFPLLLAVLLGIFAIVYVLRPGMSEPWPQAAGLRSLLTFMVSCVVCVSAMNVIGFVPAMTALMAITAWLFGAAPWKAAISGVAQALLWWMIFGPLVGGNLPKGLLGF